MKSEALTELRLNAKSADSVLSIVWEELLLPSIVFLSFLTFSTSIFEACHRCSLRRIQLHLDLDMQLHPSAGARFKVGCVSKTRGAISENSIGIGFSDPDAYQQLAADNRQPNFHIRYLQWRLLALQFYPIPQRS